jgi:hypothetical protein
MAVRGLTLSNERLYVGKKHQSGSPCDIRLAKSFFLYKGLFFFLIPLYKQLKA